MRRNVRNIGNVINIENILNIGNVRNIGSKYFYETRLNLALLPAAERVCIEFLPHLQVIVRVVLMMVMVTKMATITMTKMATITMMMMATITMMTTTARR